VSRRLLILVAGVALGAAAWTAAASLSSPRRTDAATAPVEEPVTDAEATCSVLDYDRAAVKRAVARGLAWLASRQETYGAWVGDVGNKQQDSYLVHYDAARARAEGKGHPGVTGFAGMAFLASGHVPGRGPYGPVVERALDYVLAGDPSDEFIADSETNMYGHAFATLFLAQAEGMARGRDPRLLPRLRSAAHLIARCQNETGGWRYHPYAEECDLSVTVCQTQALRAAKEAGVSVKASTIKRVIEYLDDSRVPYGPHRGCFYYKITGRSPRTKTSFAINAAAVATLHAAGVYDESKYGAALKYVDEEYVDVRRDYADHFYFWYGNWHAVQAFRMEGGPRFARYFERLAGDLLRLQRDDGRWLNYTGPGDEWSTAIACLILAVPDGLLPLFAN
jgi:hypothetical protein